MNRRQLLAISGVALSTSHAGCISDSRFSGDSEGENGDSDTNDADIDNGNASKDDQTIEEDARIDEPLHEITLPDEPGEHKEPEWNDDYLGEHMEEEPSLDFQLIEIPQGLLRNRQLTNYENNEYWVELLRNETEQSEVLDIDEADENTRELLDGVDFDESVLVVVETGYGSGSIEQRWARTEGIDDGIHLHGYYSDPFEQTSDLTTWVSLLEVKYRGNDLGFARVSLTVNENRRVNFNSTESAVAVDD